MEGKGGTGGAVSVLITPPFPLTPATSTPSQLVSFLDLLSELPGLKPSNGVFSGVGGGTGDGYVRRGRQGFLPCKVRRQTEGALPTPISGSPSWDEGAGQEMKPSKQKLKLPRWGDQEGVPGPPKGRTWTATTPLHQPPPSKAQSINGGSRGICT